MYKTLEKFTYITQTTEKAKIYGTMKQFVTFILARIILCELVERAEVRQTSLRSLCKRKKSSLPRDDDSSRLFGHARCVMKL